MRSVEGYVGTSIWPIQYFWGGSFSNSYQYYSNVWYDFWMEWKILIALIILHYVYIGVRDSNRNKIITFLILICSVIGGLVLAFGLYPVLQYPLFEPRGMYGFGVMIALLAVTAVNTCRDYFVKLICLGLCWCFFAFSFTYGNALSKQKDIQILEFI